MLTFYPWQEKQWQQLQSLNDAKRLPHAILLSGAEGIGLGHFANCLGASLLCEQVQLDNSACGECKSCMLYQAGNHPDMLVLRPEEKGKQIKVDAIRELIDYIHLSSQFGRYKIAIIEPAEAMNRSSANSLLKTLEEPPPGSLMLLLSHQAGLLPITIRSRCQKIVMPAANDEQTLAWLRQQASGGEADVEKIIKLAPGVPLKALELLESDTLEHQQLVLNDLLALKHKQLDPVSTAEKWQAIGVSEVLQWLLSFFHRMTRIKMLNSPAQDNNSNINRQLQELTNGLDLAQLLTCYALILKDYHAVGGPISLNKQGLLEEIIVQWQSLK